MHQDQSVGTKRSGKWYARAVPIGVIDTRGLSEIIQRNCTVKRSDVMAVIEELVEVMKDQMQDRSAKAFTITDNIEGMHVVFTPERSHDQAGNRTKQFLQGVKVEELPENKVDKDQEGE